MEDDRDTKGRFKKGVCPNPTGRPRKDRSVHAAILTAASATVAVTEKGRRKNIRKIEAAATQLANKGAAGEDRAVKMLLDYAAKAEASASASRPVEAALSLSDDTVVEAFLAEYRRHLEEEEG